MSFTYGLDSGSNNAIKPKSVSSGKRILAMKKIDMDKTQDKWSAMMRADQQAFCTQNIYGDGSLWNPPSPHSRINQVGRAMWGIVWLLLFRPSPRLLMGWRRFLLRLFGSRIGPGANIHPSVRIWAPWNLRVGKSVTLSWGVDCYCVAPVTLEDYVIVSQYSYLCAATHDFNHPHRPVISAPITIGPQCWICADVFIGPGVTIGEGAIVGARSSVFSNIRPWCVAVGCPAKPIRERPKPASSP
jgi:putative colanic acid biosynthesis acetyltransferase WcaF